MVASASAVFCLTHGSWSPHKLYDTDEVEAMVRYIWQEAAEFIAQFVKSAESGYQQGTSRVMNIPIVLHHFHTKLTVLEVNHFAKAWQLW